MGHIGGTEVDGGVVSSKEVEEDCRGEGDDEKELLESGLFSETTKTTPMIKEIIIRKVPIVCPLTTFLVFAACVGDLAVWVS